MHTGGARFGVLKNPRIRRSGWAWEGGKDYLPTANSPPLLSALRAPFSWEIITRALPCRLPTCLLLEYSRILIDERFDLTTKTILHNAKENMKANCWNSLVRRLCTNVRRISHFLRWFLEIFRNVLWPFFEMKKNIAWEKNVRTDNFAIISDFL